MERARIPGSGRDRAEVLRELDELRCDDVDFRAGRTWSLVYYAGDEHDAFLKEAAAKYFSQNGLNPLAFKSLKRMESDVVDMTAGMLNGPSSAVGTMTSGGTESILLAVKAWRDRARKRWPWIRRPNVVLPATAHPAFDKAAECFGLRLRRAPVHADGTADVAALRRLVNRNTVLLVASAPQYVVGVVDPIPEIGQLAQERGLPLHVDACFGGFLLPWLERVGVALPAFDFRVPGVSSMSADIHKFGYAVKGASVLVYRDPAALREQFFVTTSWPGGIYASATMAGTRPGGPIAGAWAALHALGEDGYVELARGSWAAAQQLRAGIEAIDGLRVLGLPHSTVVTWAASEGSDVDVYAVADRLQEAGWCVDRQQHPPSVHCTVSAANIGVVDDYLAAVSAAVAEVRADPSLAEQGEAAVYGLMSKIPIRAVVADQVRGMLLDMHAPGGSVTDLEDGIPEVVRKNRARIEGALELGMRVRNGITTLRGRA